jgi:two-component system, NarL family, response regulator LiaR
MRAGVLIVCGQPLFGDVLALRLGAEDDLSVLATVADPHQAIDTSRVVAPDVLVIDASDYAPGAATTARMLRAGLPGARIVIIGTEDDPVAVCDALEAGALAWVSRETTASVLVEAIHRALADEIYVPPRILTPIIRNLQRGRSTRSEDEARLARLSERERTILEFMVAGLHRDAIARQLGVSLNTVRTHAQNCYAKLGVHSSLEAVHFAFRAGLRPQLTVTAGNGREHSRL